MRKGALTCILAVTFLLMLPLAFPQTDVGAGNDAYRSNTYIDTATTGYKNTSQSVLLKDAGGSDLTYTTESHPLICDVDSSIEGNEIIIAEDDNLLFYNSGGQLLKQTSWPSPQNPPTCYDIDNDGKPEVLGVVVNLGTPVFRVYGDNGGGSLAIKSENTLTGLGGAPYSSVTCIESVDVPSGEGICAFTTQNKVQVYSYDSGVGNFGTLLSDTTQASTFTAQPVFINWDDAFDTFTGDDFYYLMVKGNTSIYRYNVSVFSELVAGKVSLDLTVPIYDFSPLTANFKVTGTPDMQIYYNQSWMFGGTPTLMNLTLFQVHPYLAFGDNVATSDTFTRSPAGDIRLANFDYNEDGYTDVVYADADVVGTYDVRCFYTIHQYDGLTGNWGSTSTTNKVTVSSIGAPPISTTSQTGRIEYQHPLVHDIDGDGDLELSISSRIDFTGHGSCIQGATSYLEAGNVALTSMSVNVSTSTTSGTQHTFGDVNQDGYYDFIYANALHLHPDGEAVGSTPTFEFTETAPTPNRCTSTSPTGCTVTQADQVNYTVTIDEPDGDAVYVSYDCDTRFDPSYTTFAVTDAATYNFSCTYADVGDAVTSVYVDDEPTYNLERTVAVTVTDILGAICNFNGIPEPSRGETEENCLADFTESQTQAELTEEENATAQQQERESIYTDAGFNVSQDFVSVTVDDDGEVTASGTLEDVRQMTQGIFVRLFSVTPYLLILVVVLALIVAFSTGGRRRR